MRTTARVTLGLAGVFFLLPSLLPAQTGTISGEVVDALSSPVGGISVELRRPWGDVVATTTSGSTTGTYSFTGLDDGEYLVRVPSDPARDLVGAYYRDVHEHDQDLATVLEIVAGGTISGVDFELAAAGSLSGTLFGLASGESVELQLFDAYNGRFRGSVRSDAATAAFTLEGLPAGTFHLFTDARGTDRALQWWDARTRRSLADPIGVGADEDILGKEMTLGPGTSISGTVLLTPDPGDGGATLERMGVGVVDAATHDWVHYTQIPADGVYEIPNLPPGTYVVEAQTHDTGYVREVWVPGADLPGQSPVFQQHEGEPVSVDVGLPATGIDFLLEEGRRITGRVFLESVAVNGVQDPGEPGLEHVEVAAERTDGTWVNGTGTAGNGDFVLPGLPPDRYRIRVESSDVDQPFVAEVWRDRAFWEAGDLVDVEAGDAAGIDFGVVQDRVISGRVFLDFDDDQVRDPDEPGFQNVAVRAYDASTGRHVGHAAVAPDGRWSIGVRSGIYLVEAQPHQRTLLREHWRNAFFQDQAEAVDVRTGDATGIDFGLVDGAIYGTLRGRLVDADTGTGIAGVRLQIERFETGEWVPGTTTVSDGSFALTTLPPGSYRIYFETRDSNAAHDTDYVSSYWSADGTPGVLDPELTRVEFPEISGDGTDLGTFALEHGGSISGTVHPPAGETLPVGLWVGAFSAESGGADLPGVAVAADGGYRIRGIPAPATYRVQLGTGGTDLVPVFFWTAAESTFDHDTATAVQVAVGAETAGIDLFPRIGGGVSGTVTRAADGTPVAGFPVHAYLVDDPLGRQFWGGHTETGSDGVFTLRGLPGGDYTVRTDGRDPDLANQTYPETVPVTEGMTTGGVDFVLEPGGRITGTVTRADTGDPVVGIRVEAADYDTGEWLSDAHTGTDGSYAILGLVQGRSYRVQVRTQDGPDPQFFNFVAELYDDRLVQREADRVTLPADPGGAPVEVAGIDFALELGGAISGVVRAGATGEPLQGVWIWAEDYDGTGFGNGDHTDHNGFYVIRGLPADSYRVSANPFPSPYAHEIFDDTRDWSRATPVTVEPVPAGGPIPITEPIDFDLAPAFRISGRITEAGSGTPVPGVLVRAGGDDLAFWPETRTADDGSYELLGLPDGRFEVTVEPEGTDYARQQRTVEIAGADLTGIDFVLEPGARISGRVWVDDLVANGVYDPGEGRSGVYVEVDDSDSGRFVSDTVTGDDGLYAVRGVAAGSYWVQIPAGEHNLVPMFWPGAFRWEEATPVAVTADAGGAPRDVTGVDLRAVQGHEIRGQVFYDADGDGLRGPDEPGVPNAQPRGQTTDGFFFLGGDTDADGDYVLHGAHPGTWTFWVEARDTPYAGEIYKVEGGAPVGTWRWSEGDPVEVAGDLTGIDFSLELGGGITGTVRAAATGEPLAGIVVNVNDFDGDGFWGWAQTATDGTYLADGLPPGRYRVDTRDDTGDYVLEIHRDAYFREDASPVSVSARSTPTDPLATPVDFDLDRAGAIEGFVYGDGNGDGSYQEGEPLLAGVHVGAEEAEPPHRWLFGVDTASDGTYRLGGLPPGMPLRIVARPNAADYVPAYWDDGDDGGALYSQDAVSVTPSAGTVTTGIRFGLAEGGSISGTVLDGDGRPISGLWVHAAPIEAGLPDNGGQTGLDGRYTIHGLVPGDYRVETGGGEYAFERFDDRTDWRLADPVTVAVGQTTPGIDFVLPRVPTILSGPSPASGERGSTVTGVSLQADGLHGGVCAPTPAPPCVRIELGAGVTVQNAILDGATETLTFDLVLAADAPLGRRTLSLVNDQSLEDGAAVRVSAFEVQPAASGDVPAPSAERLYVTDSGSSTLRVYGSSDLALLGTTATCSNPDAAALSGDGAFVFVACGDRSVSIIDTRLGGVGEEVARRLLVGSFGEGSIVATEDFLYSIDRETGEARLQTIDRATWRAGADVALPAPAWSVRVDPAGTTLYAVLRTSHQVAVVDVDPAHAGGPTHNTVVSTIPLPEGASPSDLAFASGGGRVLVAGRRELFVLDAALARSDPENAVVASLETPGGGTVDAGHHPGSGKELAFVGAGDSVWVVDVTPGMESPQVLRTIDAGYGLSTVHFGGGRVYLSYWASLDLWAFDTTGILSSPALPLIRFDGVGDGTGLATPGGGLVTGPAPGPPPASAPEVTLGAGSPATNGAPFEVTLLGGPFEPGAIVSLQGTHVRGNLLAASETELTVELPATAPAGEHAVVVSHPGAPGAGSGLAAQTLMVEPPAEYAPSQTLYATSYGGGRVVEYGADGRPRTEMLTQPFPARLTPTPDGRLGLVNQFYGSPQTRWDELPASYLDMTVVDLDHDSPTYGEVVATLPWIWTWFARPAVTPTPDDPDGILAYAPNLYMSDTVSVIDPERGVEVDLDGNPNTQSIPLNDPYTWIYGEMLPGITRIELDEQVTDRSLSPNAAALTPDGSLLYVANRRGSVSVVDTATHTVRATLTLGGDLRSGIGIVATPPGTTGDVFVYVTGYDGSGRPALFVLQAGVFDGTALVDKIPMPVPELPREIEISRDGGTVFLTARLLGELWAVDVPTRQGDAILRIPLEPGTFDVAEAVEDRLLYVSNGFRSEIYVLDLAPGAGLYDVVTTLAAPPSPSVTVAPATRTGRVEVHRVTPTTGAPAGNEPVVVSGSGFEPGARVFFGGAEAGAATVNASGTVVECLTPLSPLAGDGTGAVEVKVVNPDEKTGILQGGFTYVVDTSPPVFTTPPYVVGQTLVGDPGAETATVELRWRTDEASTSVVEYRAVGEADFLEANDPALVTLHVVTLTGLAPGTAHEVRATSVDAQGNGASSPPAAEPPLGFTTPSAPDVTPPVIVSGPTVSVTTDSATIRWQTDEHASSAVQYDAQMGDGLLDRRATGPAGTLHSVTLTGLPANTEHEYRTVSFDPHGNGPTRSDLATFRTAALPDATPPVILAGPEVSYLGSDLVIVSWETDEPSTSFVTYGVHSADEEGVIDLDLVTFHAVFLTDLAPGTAYGYRAGSTDASGNTVRTDDPFATAGTSAELMHSPVRTLDRSLDLGVTTLPAGSRLAIREAAVGFTTPETADAEPPTLLGTAASALSHDRVLVTVETDEATSLRVRFGVTDLEREAFDPTFRKRSDLVLTGLEGGATHRLVLEVTDPAGNATVTDELLVTTPEAPDTVPPAVSGVGTAEVTATTARLVWQTDEPADATARFGPAGGSFAGTAGRLGLATSHSLLLTGLAPGTQYTFEVASRDGSGNRGAASGSFTTAEPQPVLTSVAPSRAVQGATQEVALNGIHLAPQPTVDFGPGIAVSGVTVNASGTQVRATLVVDAGALVGARSVTVTTGGGSATAPFAVVDETVPVVTILEPSDGAEITTYDVPVRGTVSEPAEVTVNGVAATVTGGDPVTFETTVTFADQGAHRIVVHATDASGNRGTAVVVVGVEILDVTPPTLTLAADPEVLWPANHKMVPVTIDVQVADDHDPEPEIVLVSVTSSEPDDAPDDGDGDTVNDVQGAAVGTDDREVLLRAERAGEGSGRVYTMTYRATDATGNATEAAVEVLVPHDRR